MKSLLAALCCAGLAGCAGPDVAQYRSEAPALDLAAFFTGTTDAWGMFQARGGRVARRFHVIITGSAAGGVFTLDEDFHYADGARQRRVWRLTRAADGSWRGRAADVAGEARGEIAGNALHWRYALLLPVAGRTWNMQFDDWMFLVDGCTMLNRASMRKFGIEFGQVTLAFRRRACGP
ncbi:MAG: DUF3833 domain-containing protein [Telluria sp.]